MEKIKIFSVGKWDWGGCGYFLSQAINEHTEHHSRSMRKEESRLGFPYDLGALTGQRLRVLWDWADVIHIHDAPGFKIDSFKPKPTIITYHGTRFRRAKGAYLKQANRRRYIVTVATPDLARSKMPLMPDCRPDFEVKDKHDQFTVCHSPTKREVKGTERVIEACQKVGVRLDLIEGMPWNECIERKSRCHLLIDQFELGYGCNAVEAWSMGMPVISDGDPQARKAISRCFGYFPFMLPEPTLEDAIARMRDDGEWREDWSDTGWAHFETWHSPRAASRIAVGFYEQAIDRSKALVEHRRILPSVNLPPGNLVLVRYLGGSLGSQEWFPVGGTRAHYRFDARQPVRYVHENDVPWFLEVKDRGEKQLFKVEDDADQV